MFKQWKQLKSLKYLQLNFYPKPLGDILHWMPSVIDKQIFQEIAKAWWKLSCAISINSTRLKLIYFKWSAMKSQKRIAVSHDINTRVEKKMKKKILIHFDKSS